MPVHKNVGQLTHVVDACDPIQGRPQLPPLQASSAVTLLTHLALQDPLPEAVSAMSAVSMTAGLRPAPTAGRGGCHKECNVTPIGIRRVQRTASRTWPAFR